MIYTILADPDRSRYEDHMQNILWRDTGKCAWQCPTTRSILRKLIGQHQVSRLPLGACSKMSRARRRIQACALTMSTLTVEVYAGSYKQQ